MTLRAGFHGTVGQPSAQVIDGSLKFDGSYLKRTPGSAGNRKIFTWSGWVKLNELASFYLFSVPDSSGHASFMFDSGQLRWNTYSTSTNGLFTSNAYFRDTGWYHVVFAFDATESTTTDRIKVYVNGERLTSSSYTTPDGSDTPVNNTVEHSIGARYQGATSGDVNITNNYFIDGLALTPENFGFTDPLTNTWRPKKYTGTFGTNGFWLPMDGNSPIGEDKSGKGNNYTPINFGGSLELDNPNVSGARPILNTTQGGTQAEVGVFGSKQNVGYAVTVYNDGGGNKYYIDGVKQATLTGLIRGATYTFDTSDSTVSSHPFRFSESDGGSEYTNGVAAITGTATTITIPYNSSNELYYYCTSHSGMGSSITGITTNEKLADQYASHCVLALPLVGANSDVSASIACTSTTKTMTSGGNAAATLANSNFYSGSFDFDGTGDSISAASSSDFAFGTGDFTIEMWVYPDALTSTLWDSGAVNSNGNCAIFIDGSYIYWRMKPGTDIDIQHTVSGYQINRWSHLAFVRQGSTCKIYLNGKEVDSGTNASDVTATSAKFGTLTGFSYDTNAQIQDVRVYKGVAKYTSDFIPAATNPDILPDTPSGVSGGSKLTKITDGAVTFGAFDGTDDYLQISDNADFEMGAGDFTIEAFVYNQKNAVQSIITKYGNSASDSSFWLGTLSSTNPSFYWYSGGSSYNINGGTGTLPLNKWSHVVAQRTSGDIYLFVDGKVVASATGASGAYSFNDTSEPVVIGSDSGSGEELFQGFISNVRIVKGTGVYNTIGFTPPTAPLTNVTNTKLLCCQSPTSVESSAVGPITSDFYSAGVYLTATTYTDRGGSSCTITNNDSVTSSSAGTNSFGLTTAADMTGQDRVDINMGNVSGSFFQSEWTLEMFFKKDASDNNWFVGTSTSGASWQTGWSLNVDGTTLKWNYNDQSGGQSKSTGITINNDTWYFMRVQRTPSTSQSRLYIEVYDSPTNRSGTFDGTVQDDQSHSNNTLKIGDANGNSNNLTANWQFANVMITAGTRRNQVVPTLSSGQRVLNATIDSLVVPIGNPTATNFNPFITDINTVRGQETGYATLNPLAVVGSATYSDGNLKVTGSAAYRSTPSTIGMSEGKWYVEYFFDTWVNDSHVGVMNDISPATTGTWAGNTANGFAWAGDSGDLWTSGSTYNSSFDVSFGTGDTCQIAFDADNGRMYFGKNGLWLKGANPSVGTGANWTGLTDGPYHPFVTTTNGTICSANFGQKPFKFPPPDGFQPLNDANVRPETVIARPDQFVGVTTYTGSVSPQTVGGINFTSDLIWIKSRTHTGWHILQDSVRGYGKILFSNSTNVEVGNANDLISDVSSTGFSVNTNYAGGTDTATTTTSGTNSYVGWCWKAGGSKNTFNVDDVGYASAAAAGLNGGTLTVTGASVGTKQGFSIIKFTGTGVAGSVSHGLTQKPDFIIAKNIDGTANDWGVHHSSLTDGTYTLYLNGTATAAAETLIWSSAATNSLINVGSGALINESAKSTILYSWHDVPGLQKFGSYKANTDADGPYIQTGFKVGLLMIKAIGGTSNSNLGWFIYDTERNKFNPSKKYLRAESAAIEGNANDVDLLSDGFKLRTNVDAVNNATYTDYIYCAWAEAPSVNLFGGSSNAR